METDPLASVIADVADIGSLSNDAPRQLRSVLVQALVGYDDRTGGLARRSRAAKADAAGFSASLTTEVVLGCVGATLPPPFNAIAVAAVLGSGGYKLYDGRAKFGHAMATHRQLRLARMRVRQARELAEQIAAEVVARIHDGRWP